VIAKIMKGGGFRGAADYLMRAGRDEPAGIIIAGNMVARDSRGIATEFKVSRQLRPDVNKPVWHASLALPPGQSLNDHDWDKAARVFMEEMGFDPTAHQWTAIRHDDREHQHIHILASRIRVTDGKLCRERRGDYKLSHAAARKAAAAVGLKPVDPAPSYQRRASLRRGELAHAERVSGSPHKHPKLQIATRLDAALAHASSLEQFKAIAADHGVDVKVSSNSGGVYGVSYRLADPAEREGFKVEWVKGSQVGKAYTITSISRRLAGEIDTPASRRGPRVRQDILQRLKREKQDRKEILRWDSGWVAAIATESEIRWRTGSAIESAVCASLAREKGWTEMVIADRGTLEKNLAAIAAYHRRGISVTLNGQHYPVPLRGGSDSILLDDGWLGKTRPGSFLLDHGAAPFQHVEDNTMSYFVVLQMPNGDARTIWGVDLERAIDEAGVRVGDEVHLDATAKEQVKVKYVDKETGELIEKVAERNVWRIEKLNSDKQASWRTDVLPPTLSIATERERNGPVLQPHFGDVGREPPPAARNRLRTLSELGVVCARRSESRTQLLLQGDVRDRLDSGGTAGTARMRWHDDRAASDEVGVIHGHDGTNPRAGQGGGGTAAPDHGVTEVDSSAGERPTQEIQRPGGTARPTTPAAAGAGGAAGKAVEDGERHRTSGQETSAQQGEEQVDLLDFLSDPVGTRERAQRALKDMSQANPGDHAARIIAEAHQAKATGAIDPLDFLSEQSQPEPPEQRPVTTQEHQEQAPVTHQPQPSPDPDPIPTDEDLRLAEDEAVEQLTRYQGDMEGVRPRSAAQIEGDLIAARQQREWHEMQSLIHRMKPSTMKEIASLRDREAELGIALALARKREDEARRQIRRDPAAMSAIHSRATGLARERAERKKADEQRRLADKARRELAQRQKEEEAKRQREREEVKPTKKRKGKTEWTPK